MRCARFSAFLVLCLTAVLFTPSLVVLAQDGDLEYTPEEIQSISAERFLMYMANPQPDYQKFAAMHALSAKIKAADTNTKINIINMLVTAMNDRSRGVYQRFQCCYAISGSGDERGIPYLINILYQDPINTMRSVAAEALADYKGNADAHNALVQAAGQERDAKVLEVLNRRLSEGDQGYSPEEIKNTSADMFLQYIAKPQAGYDKFAAMRALGAKAKASDPQTRWEILNKVSTVMLDRSRTENQRFQCCYVISISGDEQWIPQLVYVLNDDPSEVMRSVAAEALAAFPKNADAQDALLVASQYETSQRVLDVINKNASTMEYTTKQIDEISVDEFIEKLQQPDKGYQKFAAMHALTKKAKTSDADGRRAILSTVAKVMNDKARSELQRFQCCYVISGCGDEAWVPSLIDVLKNDSSATMRAVAAEALGVFASNNNAAARGALENALKTETNQRVREVITRRLGIKVE